MCVAVPLIVIACIRNLKLLAPYSSVAAALSLSSFSIILFFYVFREIPSLKTREAVGTIKTIPIFFGTVLFAMEAIGIVSTNSKVLYLQISIYTLLKWLLSRINIHYKTSKILY